MKTGILLVNLGTPNSPELNDVRRYLHQFLTDKRVIDLPWFWRQILVKGRIVPFRYKESAKAYKKIWSAEGSPLKVHGFSIRDKLQELMGHEYIVDLAMRYQNPSIESILERFYKLNLKKLVIFPLFPQYSSATTGSVYQKVMEICAKWNLIPEMVFIREYASHPAFIRALAAVGSVFKITDYDHLLFSFHGLPLEEILKNDPKRSCLKKGCCHNVLNNHSCYSAQCHATAFSLMNALNIPKEFCSIAFQSRLGKAPWLQPYVSEHLTKLASQGIKRLLVFSPSFVCDCLETLYEISMEYGNEFKKAGGEHLQLVPGLNDHPLWLEAIHTIIKER